MSAPDPVTLEVVRNALYAIAEEMSVIVMRSARSPLLKEAGDLSSALTDAQGRIIAQGRDIPMHMGVMGFTVKALLERIPAERMRDGDVWLLNLPEVGGNHLPDVKAVRRLLRGALGSLRREPRHGRTSRRGARQLRDLGTRNATRRACARAGEDLHAAGPESETIVVICRTCAAREEREGDLLAQYAADDVAARRLAELFERYGAETIEGCFERLHAESEAGMRAALRALPDGVWEGEDWLDDDGVDDRPIRIHVRIDKRGDHATFDFSGSDRQVRGPVNTTYFITCSSGTTREGARRPRTSRPTRAATGRSRSSCRAAACSTAIPIGPWSAATTRRRSAWWTRS